MSSTESAASIIQYMRTTGLFQFYCAPCGKYFQHLSLLELHNATHTPPAEPPSQRHCPACDLTGSDFQQLAEHVIQHALGKNDWVRCSLCGLEVSRVKDNRMQMHLETKHPGELATIWADWPFPCEHCPRRYFLRNRLVRHVGEMHPDASLPSDPTEVCPYCGKVVTVMHLHHRKNRCRAPWDRLPYRCQQCQSGYFTHGQFIQHVKSVHRGQNHPDAALPLDHMKTCPYCGKLFTALRQHLKQNRCPAPWDQKPHRCYRCQTGYCTHGSFMHHVAKAHAGDVTVGFAPSLGQTTADRSEAVDGAHHRPQDKLEEAEAPLLEEVDIFSTKDVSGNSGTSDVKRATENPVLIQTESIDGDPPLLGLTVSDELTALTVRAVKEELLGWVDSDPWGLHSSEHRNTGLPFGEEDPDATDCSVIIETENSIVPALVNVTDDSDTGDTALLCAEELLADDEIDALQTTTSSEKRSKAVTVPSPADVAVARSYMKTTGHFNYFCPPCRSTFPTMPLLDLHNALCHPMTDAGSIDVPVGKCPQCDYTGQEMLQHVNQHAFSKKDWVPCLLCGEEIYQKETHLYSKMRRHVEERHPEEFDAICPDGELQCPEMDCREKFFSSAQLVRHISSAHERERGDDQETVLDRATLEDRMQARDNPKRKYQGAQHVLRFLTRLQEESGYQCDKRPSGFMAEVSPLNHLKTHHPDDNAVRCGQCQRRCDSAGGLEEHVRAKHVGWECVYCGVTMDNHRWHPAQHKVDDRFPCPQCSRLFKRYAAVTRHMERDHWASHVCVACGHICKTWAVSRAHARACGAVAGGDDDLQCVKDDASAQREHGAGVVFHKKLGKAKRGRQRTGVTDCSTSTVAWQMTGKLLLGIDNRDPSVLPPCEPVKGADADRVAAASCLVESALPCAALAMTGESFQFTSLPLDVGQSAMHGSDAITDGAVVSSLAECFLAGDNDQYDPLDPVTALSPCDSPPPPLGRGSSCSTPHGESCNGDSLAEMCSGMEAGIPSFSCSSSPGESFKAGDKEQDPQKALLPRTSPSSPVATEQWCDILLAEMPSGDSLLETFDGVNSAHSASVIDFMRTTGFFQFYCAPCRKTFQHLSLLELHNATHSPPAEPPSQRHCPACDFAGNDFQQLAEHVIQHALGKNDWVRCPFCEQNVSRVKDNRMRLHLGTKHPDELAAIWADWPFPCKHCPRRYLSRRWLIRHMAEIHPGVSLPPGPSVLCPYCGKLLTKLPQHLRENRCRVAWDKKPYRCQQCQTGYFGGGQLMQHVYDVHPGKAAGFAASLPQTTANVSEQVDDADPAAPLSDRKRKAKKLQKSTKRRKRDISDRAVASQSDAIPAEASFVLAAEIVASSETVASIGRQRSPVISADDQIAAPSLRRSQRLSKLRQTSASKPQDPSTRSQPQETSTSATDFQMSPSGSQSEKKQPAMRDHEEQSECGSIQDSSSEWDAASAASESEESDAERNAPLKFKNTAKRRKHHTRGDGCASTTVDDIINSDNPEKSAQHKPKRGRSDLRPPTASTRCPICRRCWPEIEQHYREKHPELVAELIPCRLKDCKAVFLRQKSLRIHMLRAHYGSVTMLNTDRQVAAATEEVDDGVTLTTADDARKPPPPKAKSRRSEVGLRKTTERCLICRTECSKKGIDEHYRNKHPDSLEKLAQAMTCRYPDCNRAYLTEKGLKYHMSQAHPTGNTTVSEDDQQVAAAYIIETGFLHFRCTVCQLNFSRKPLLDLHVLQHDSAVDREEQRQCPACEYTPASLTDLSQHVNVHGFAMSLRQRQPCMLCGKSILNYHGKNLRVHMERVHADVMLQRKQLQSFPCGKCEKTFDTAYAMKQHVNIAHKKTMCLYCCTHFASCKEYHVHVAEHKVEGVFPCPQCTASFSSYMAIRGHFSIHDASRVCLICRKVCRSAKRLEGHLRHCVKQKAPTRQRERPELDDGAAIEFPCSVCNKRLVGMQKLFWHMKSRHFVGSAKEKRQQWKKEKETNAQLKAFFRPKRTMTFEEFNHRCEACRKGFRWRESLLSHIEKKHASGGKNF
ncbi:uncharacterized protein LOC129594662 [Paramacrobiotus metropolitanus]|uniref:uncharacterized protein LOC129594662 n=1 Tax=Paramacrobiotus metropolitanus TaxID=2943436 RepID=UPI0024460801|nr:uncharacterized protein LOC129594662 [Paramacrobiotus metropolitanus]XP_055347403.1 uncharacterized protein LOC129594662 [Paramacrobiotus metropolitanus]XP_055347404.1 uncharacterized protein LOC129594662 [Paramacrobiotus metropolitanus]